MPPQIRKTLTVLAWPVLAIVSFLAGLLAFPLAPLAVMLARPTDRKIDVPYKQGNSDNPPPLPWKHTLYRLPRIFRFLETQDENDGLLPGGLYEPTINDTFWKWGWRWAAIQWLWRNRAFRASHALGFQFERPTEYEATIASANRLAAYHAEQLRKRGSTSLTLYSRRQLTLRMRGSGRPENPHRPGVWVGTIAEYELGHLKRWVWGVQIVTPKLLFGRCLWFPLGWHIRPFFDSVLTNGEFWPALGSAAGRIAFPLRQERVVDASPQG